MNKRKTIAVGIVLALILIIGGTIAFFTDTDTKTNTFTIGDGVDIQITETFNETDAQNIHPGQVVNKAPSIKNIGTVPAYVFAEVVIPCYASTGTTVNTPLYAFTPNAGWLLIGTSEVNTTDKTITYIYAYGTASQMTSLAANTTTTTALFSSVTLEPTLTSAQKATASTTPNIDIVAYGIQTENVGNTPAEVWACIPH